MSGSDGEVGHRTGGLARPLGTPIEVAQFLQVPVKTLYRWRGLGEGPPALSVGRHLRYRWRDVEAWLETRGDGGLARSSILRRGIGGTP
jgi:predicted DNA-binding transcriptional regulator AlpA